MQAQVRDARTRYARTSSAGTWVSIPPGGAVEAVLASMDDGHDRAVMAWPEPLDSGLVIAAIALREARTSGRVSHATLGLWPWRKSATYAARSILVHPEDIARAAARACTGVQWSTRASDALALDLLSRTELRLNDLLSRKDETGKARPEVITIRSPTLLETTAIFPPSADVGGPPYLDDAEQVLRRVRRYTLIDKRNSTMGSAVAAVGSPRASPFALMGLEPAPEREIGRCLAYERFTRHGLDAVVVDLSRLARGALALDWEPQLRALLSALDAARLPRRPPVVVLCEDAFGLRRARAALREHAGKAKPPRPGPRISGTLQLSRSLLATPDVDAAGSELAPVVFEADLKDATLVPLRDRLVGLMRRLREAGHEAAAAVSSALRFLRACASLPVGCAEARQIAARLFDGDDEESIRDRGAFFPSAALQPMAAAAGEAPEFAAEISQLRNEVSARCAAWENATPTSLKLERVLGDDAWNARDVLLVLPDGRTAEVFRESELGSILTACGTTHASQLSAELAAKDWRRLIVLRPEPRAVRVLLTMRARPERVLLLGDLAGIGLLTAELEPLTTLQEFARFAPRAAALSAALTAGGASEAEDFAEAEFRYAYRPSTEVIDLSQAGGSYTGELVRLRLEGGSCVVYRAGGEVLVFVPAAVRPFRRVAAQNVSVGDSIVVLGSDLRARLVAALARSRQAVGLLKQYHEAVEKFRDGLPGDNATAKAKCALAAMRAIDPSIGDHELQNVRYWLSVTPSDHPQAPRAARDARRFIVFMQAAGISKPLAEAFWGVAIQPARVYSAREGHLVNRRIVNFVLDPEAVTASGGGGGFDGLWQSIVASVDVIAEKEIVHG